MQNVAAEVLQQRILRLLPTEWKPYMQELATKRSPPIVNKTTHLASRSRGNSAQSAGNEKNAAEIQLHDMPPDEFAFLLAQWLASTGLCGPRIALSWMAQAGNTLDLLAKLNNFITQLGYDFSNKDNAHVFHPLMEISFFGDSRKYKKYIFCLWRDCPRKSD